MISDLYIIKLLIAVTEKPNSNMEWQYKEGDDRYFASVDSDGELVEFKIGHVVSRVGSRILLELSNKYSGKVYIEEPHMSVSLFRKYDSEDEKELSDAMRSLFSIIVRQQSSKELRDIENKEERKQEIFKKVLYKIGQART